MSRILRIAAAALLAASTAAIACPADCDGNGELNVLDFVCFQGLFLSGDDAADMNGDGVLNILDFVAYQQAFQAGCPELVEVVVTGFAFDGDDPDNPATIIYLWETHNQDILAPDDVIVAYRGIPIESGAQLKQVILELPDVVPGEIVKMEVQREGELLGLEPEAILVQVPAEGDPPQIKNNEFNDRNCVEKTVNKKEVCRCDDNGLANDCIQQTFRNADADGVLTTVRTACSDSEGGSCNHAIEEGEDGK